MSLFREQLKRRISRLEAAAAARLARASGRLLLLWRPTRFRVEMSDGTERVIEYGSPWHEELVEKNTIKGAPAKPPGYKRSPVSESDKEFYRESIAAGFGLRGPPQPMAPRVPGAL